jgi:hypothetical protein
MAVSKETLGAIQHKISQEIEFLPQSRAPKNSRSIKTNENPFRFDDVCAANTRKLALEWFGGEKLSARDQRFSGATQVAWSQSTFAKKFREILDGLGASTYVMDSPRAPGLDVLVGRWLLSNGLPFPLVGEVWRDSKTGKEFIYWHCEALVHTRHFHDEANSVRENNMPQLFQSLAFLSETPNQALIVNSGKRFEVFGSEDASAVPSIAIHCARDHYLAVIVLNDNGQEEYSRIWTPETILYGYIFEEIVDPSRNEVAIAVASTSLSKAADILVDGFANCRKKDESDFQAATSSDSAIYQEGELDHFDCGNFVAGPVTYYVDAESVYVYAACQEISHYARISKDPHMLRLALNGYQEIMSKGSGVSLPHSMNSYVYLMQNLSGPILGLSEEERSGFHDYGAKLLKYVTGLPVDLQDANACSNLALLEISRKRYSEALQAVNDGITILKQDRSQLPDSIMGNSKANENPGIKLELFATRAELIYRSGDKAKAQDLALKVLEDAESIKYDGAEIAKVKWILAQ